LAGRRAQRLIAGIYSRAAHRLYDPLVVHGSFKLLSGGRLHELVAEQGRRAVSAAGGGPILDVPVGTAYFTRAVAAAHSGLVVGVDIAEGMVRESALLAEREGLSNLSLVQTSIHALPFEDGTFPAILCTNGLQVIPNLRAAVSELARVLAPGGTLFVSVVGIPLRSEHLPTAFATKNVTDALKGAGLSIRERHRTRWAILYVTASTRDYGE
jgi:ubiquinone/menaquinone biosynthesis C-methylase UbiE